MAKATLEIRSLARSHTATAITTLVSIMNQPKAPAAARTVAANSLLDRGWGKAPQSVTLKGDEDSPLVVEVTTFFDGDDKTSA